MIAAPRRSVAAVVVAVTYAAMAFAVVQGRSVVTAPVVIVATAVTTKYVVRAKNVVQIQVLIAAILIKLAVRVLVVLLPRPVVTAHVVRMVAVNMNSRILIARG